MWPSCTPTRVCSPSSADRPSCTARQNRAQHRHPAARDVPHARGHDPAGPRDPRHLARARSRVAHERHHERGQRGVEAVVLERQRPPRCRRARRRPGCAPGWRRRTARADRSRPRGPRRRRAASSCVSPPGPQPTSSTRIPASRPRRRRARPRASERSAHEAVVVLGGRGELHAAESSSPTAPRQGVRSAHAHARDPPDAAMVPRLGSAGRGGAHEAALLPTTRADFNLLITSARNMFCRTASRDLRRHQGSISLRFTRPGASPACASPARAGRPVALREGPQGLPLRVRRLMGRRARMRPGAARSDLEEARGARGAASRRRRTRSRRSGRRGRRGADGGRPACSTSRRRWAIARPAALARWGRRTLPPPARRNGPRSRR